MFNINKGNNLCYFYILEHWYWMFNVEEREKNFLYTCTFWSSCYVLETFSTSNRSGLFPPDMKLHYRIFWRGQEIDLWMDRMWMFIVVWKYSLLLVFLSYDKVGSDFLEFYIIESLGQWKWTYGCPHWINIISLNFDDHHLSDSPV